VSPITRMGTSIGMAGGSLADLLDCESGAGSDAGAAVISGRLRHLYPEKSWVARSWQPRLDQDEGRLRVGEREGKAAYLGEREPYDNPATTHGICSLALGIEKDSRRARRLTILNAI